MLFSVKLYKGVSKMDILALALSIIGCLNWGLVGIFQFDLVAWLFGSATALSRVIYTVIGLAGVWCVSFFLRRARLAINEE